MSLESFYEAVGGDLPDVRGRLQDDERIEKFVKFFLVDTAYPQLIEAHESGDKQTEFRAAHTLKGTSRDMGFMRIHEPAYKLADALRPNDAGEPTAPELVDELEAQVTEAYNEVIAAAKEHLDA